MLPAYRFGDRWHSLREHHFATDNMRGLVPIGLVPFGNCPPDAVAGLRGSPMTGATFIGCRL